MRAIRTGLLAVAAAAALAAAAGRPSFAESVAEPEASPTAAPSALPEIGRTRATRSACAVLRDLIDPSIAAAGRADKRFEEARPLLANYVKKLEEKDPVGRLFLLHQIESAYLAAVDQRLAISRALGDPRIDASVTDPEVVALRKALQTLEDGQLAQIQTLGVWTIKARVDYGGRLGPATMEKSGKSNYDPFAGGDPDPMYSPPSPSDLKGTLELTGDGATDARRVMQYTGAVAAFNADHEASVHRTIAAAAVGCPRAPAR
jgi:hypothetical protein